MRSRYVDEPYHVLAMALNMEDTPILSEEEIQHRQEEAEERILNRLSASQRKRLKKALPMARLLMKYREHPKFGLISILYQYHRILQQIGARMESCGVLRCAEDVFYLRVEDVLWWEERKIKASDLQEKVDAEKEMLRSATTRELPRVICTPECDMITLSQKMQQQLKDLPPSTLKGYPASAGCVEGRAVVATDPHDTVIAKGEILVVRATDPGWTPVFAPAGGIAIEIGGVLTHGSVVAKEMGIPCVVGVAGLMDKIRTGMKIRVDGSTGIVEILDTTSCVCFHSCRSFQPFTQITADVR